jgi:hypothetical protein
MNRVAFRNSIISILAAAVLMLGISAPRSASSAPKAVSLSAHHSLLIADGSESNGGKGGKGGAKLSA